MQLKTSAVPPWRARHFVGGHPACDLANTVSDRCDTATAVDRLDSNATVLSWFRSTGLLSKSDAKGLLANPDGEIVRPLAALREAAWATLLAAAEGRSLAARPLREILTAAAAGLPEGSVLPGETNSLPAAGLVPKRAEDLTGLMALQVLDALFTLPRDRLRSCPRCGWLFFDRSKGGRRRWCSMKTCGNREKASRHYRTTNPDG